MLSIIISSYQPFYFNNLEKNIQETVGVVYEIIKIENLGVMGVCEAYNRGASMAKYDAFLFLHEDVIFHTKKWGRIIIEKLKKNNVGVIGVAGSVYVPFVPSGWWIDNDYARINIIQSYKNKNERDVITRKNFRNVSKDEKVYSLDGVFLCCRKNVFDEFKFNEKLKGYHGYDIDFSVRVANKYSNIVTGEILIEHFSEGKADKTWFLETINARSYYVIPKQQVNQKKIELSKFVSFVKQMRFYGLSKITICFYSVKYFNLRRIGFLNFLIFVRKRF